MAKKAAPKAAAKPAPKAAAKAAPKAAAAKPATKSEIFSQIAEKTGLTKKQVSDVFDALEATIKSHLTDKKGAQAFVLPGLLKLHVAKKAATPARQGINPATGEPMTIKAQPARNVVKARLLKALRDIV